MSDQAKIQELADEVYRLVDLLGDRIAELSGAHECQVALEVWHNEGSESTILHQLSGEFRAFVAQVVPVNQTVSAVPPAGEG